MTELMSEYRIRKLMDKRHRRDMKMLIKLVMETPLNPIDEYGEVAEPDGKVSIKELSKKNLDVQTRMWLTIAGQAASGDVKSAELMLKYGGFTPPAEQNVNVNLPTIIDDVTFKEIQAEEAEFEITEGENERSDSEDDDNVRYIAEKSD